MEIILNHNTFSYGFTIDLIIPINYRHSSKIRFIARSNQLIDMPDESCRMCGSPLYDVKKCVVCIYVIQKTCYKCGKMTIKEYPSGVSIS